MKPKSTLRSFLAIAGSSLLAISYTHAAGYRYWDGLTPAGAPGGGGPATWDLALGNWDLTQSADSATAWVNANLDTAVFGGTASTSGAPVQLGSAISVGGLRFDTTAYFINSTGFSLNFAATNNNITFNGNTTAATLTGPVGGTGNVALSFAAGNYSGGVLTAPGTLTLNGTSAGGWTGTTTINANMTLALAASNQGLVSTTGITLNGGAISSTNASAQASLNRINDSAGISVNGGGTFTYANTQTSAIEYAETLGAVTLNSGQFNVVLTNNQGGGGSPTNKQTLTLGSLGNNVSGSGLSRTATSAVTFSSGGTLNTTTNRISVYGSTNTTAGQIVGPWATTGASAGAQTDYAIFSGGYISAAGGTLAVTAESGWGSATDAYQFGSSQTLAADRTAAALRYTAGANPLALAGFTLKTNGILNGGSGLLTVSGTGALTATGTSGGNLFLTTGNNAITVSSKISDNGGAVTVVKSGSNGNLTLSGNNDFTGGLVLNAGTLLLSGTQSFTGGVTLNGGSLGNNSAGNGISAAALNGNTVTVNGFAALFVAKDQSLATSNTITINPTGILDIGGADGGTSTLPGVVSGTGKLIIGGNNLNAGQTIRLTNTANTFSGDVVLPYSNGGSNNGPTLSVASLGDGGKVSVGYNTGVLRQFALDSSATAALTFNTRQFELVGPSGAANLTIANNSTQAFNINTDLLVSGALGTRTLALRGTGIGLSTFAGKLENGSLTSLGVTKSESGTWTLTNTNNSYTGVTTISGGILQISTLADGGSNSPIGAAASGAAGLALSGGTLLYTGGSVTTNRGFTLSGNSTLNLSGSGVALALGNSSTSGNGSALTVTGTSGNTLTIGAVNNISSPTNPWSIDPASGISVSINGVMSGTGGFTRRGGAGPVTLNNTGNTFTGDVVVNNGNSGRGPLLALNVADYGVASALGRGTAGTGKIVLGGNGGDFSTLTFIGTGSTSNRQFALDASSFLNNNGSGALNFTGYSGDSNKFIKATQTSGARTLTLGGTYTGAANVISGTIDDNDTNGITNGFATIAIAKDGPGTWQFSATNTYTGTTSVNAGTLSLDYGTNNTTKLSDTAALNLGGGTLNLSGGSHTETVASTTLTAATSSSVTRPSGTSVLQMNVITPGTGTVNLGAASIATTLNTNNTASILGAWARIGDDWAVSAATSTASVVSTASTDKITMSGMTNGNSIRFTAGAPTGVTANTVYYVINAGLSDFQIATTPGGLTPVDITADGAAGTVNVAGAITAYTAYTDVTRQSSGTKAIANGATTNVRITEGTGGGAADITVTGTIAINTLNQSINGGTAAATVSMANQTLRTNGILMGSTAGTLTIGAAGGTAALSGTLTNQTGNNGSLTFTNNSASDMVINSVLATNGSGNTFSKAGTGTLILAGDNTFNAGFNILDGTVKAGKNSTSGSVGPFGGDAAIVLANKSTAVLDINGFNVKVYGLSGGGALGGNIILTSGKTLSVRNGNTTYGGVISGAGNFTAYGNNARLTLTNNHTYTGITTIGVAGDANGFYTFNSLADGGIASGIGQSTSAASNLVFNGTTITDQPILDYNGTVNASTNRQFTMFGNAGLSVSSATTVNWTSTAAITHGNVAAKRLLLAGSNASGLGILAAQITDSGTGANLTSVRLGLSGGGNSGASWTLTNTTNSFTGGIVFDGTTNAAGRLSYASAGATNAITFNQTTGSATLSYIGSTDKEMSGAITASALTSGTITFDASGAGAVNYSNSGSLGNGGASGAKGLVLSGTNTGNNILNGQWVNNSAGGAATLTKNGAGKWVLTGTSNAYTGATAINAGTLALGASNVLPDTTNVTIAAATLDVAAGFTDTTGTLDVSANATINLGNSSSKPAFANSAAVDWTGGRLNITGTFVSGDGTGPGTNPGSIRFGTDNTGLTVGQLSQISATGWSSFGIDANGYLTATFGGGGDVTPPTLTSITDSVSPGPVTEDASVTYTVTFSEDMDSATVTTADFDNQGTSAINIGAINETSPGVFTVVVTPTNPGTLRLRIPSGAVVSDTSANNLVVPVSDDTTITVRSKYEAWSGALDFDSDTNGDGVKNGLAFLLGAANKTDSALGLLPTVTQSGGNLILTFNMLNAANRKSASIQVQQSSDLGISDAWADSAVVPEVNGGPSPSFNGVTFNVTLGTPTNAVIATVVASEAGGTGKLFGRLKSNQ